MPYANSFNNRDRVTTEVLDIAIAAEAIQGANSIPIGHNTPAAIGMPAKGVSDRGSEVKVE